MKFHFKIFTALFLVADYSSYGQSSNDIRMPESKRLIDNVQIFTGLSLNFPDDNGWYKSVNTSSQGLISGEYQMKIGYLIGLGIGHSIRNRHEINVRIAFEQSGYLEESTSIGDNSNVYKYESNTINDYLTSQIASDLFIDKKNKFFISSGIFYSHLLKSLRKETLYLNEQITQISTVTNSSEISRHYAGILFAVGHSITLNTAYKLSLRIQGNYGLTDVVNINGLVINSNSLNFFILLKRCR